MGWFHLRGMTAFSIFFEWILTINYIKKNFLIWSFMKVTKKGSHASKLWRLNCTICAFCNPNFAVENIVSCWWWLVLCSQSFYGVFSLWQSAGKKSLVLNTRTDSQWRMLPLCIYWHLLGASSLCNHCCANLCKVIRVFLLLPYYYGFSGTDFITTTGSSATSTLLTNPCLSACFWLVLYIKKKQEQR